ncbi:MAG: hypothetical protein HDQ95_00510, partial [Roseburia sp.]|nr:hypothetical protein [Roseburia sp.]
ITLSDGEVKEVDLSALITQYEFVDSGTIAYTVYPDGRVTSAVKEGSIEERHLRPNYLADIKVEVAKAEASKNAAATSELNAKSSENAAKASQTAAKTSETNAATSAANAESSATTATSKATAAANSAAAAKTSETNAKTSETAAASSKTAAATSATSAATSETTATTKATEASTYADKSKSYAVGGTGKREGEDTDNAQYYAMQAATLVNTVGTGGLIPMGTVTFKNLPTSDIKSGWMYNISDAFDSDSRFKDGGSLSYPMGSNVYYTADGMWDVLSGNGVSGIRGDAEKSGVYRLGNVTLTAANIGAAPTSHASTATTYGVSTAANYGHAMASSTTPKENGTAAIGTETAKFARGDHVHPLQTSVSGNAGTATKLATARTIDGVSFNGSAAITHYGTCSTAAATAAKVVACTGFSLVAGATVRVKFTVTNTAANPTLNVNSTGAKAIYYAGAAITANMIKANRIYGFVYDGSNYEMVAGPILYSEESNSANGTTVTIKQ